MDRFRIRTGELVGILGPGFFVVVDLCLVLNARRGSPGDAIKRLVAAVPSETGAAVAVIFGLFMSCYLAGLVLRLFRPERLDWWSIRLRRLWDGRFRRRTEHAFPYLDWLEAEGPDPATTKGIQPEHVERFRQTIAWLRSQQESPPGAGSGQEECKPTPDHRVGMWFNAFKLHVCVKAPQLFDEILFAEGASRFVAGLAYASLVALAVAPAATPSGVDPWPLVSFVLFYMPLQLLGRRMVERRMVCIIACSTLLLLGFISWIPCHSSMVALRPYGTSLVNALLVASIVLVPARDKQSSQWYRTILLALTVLSASLLQFLSGNVPAVLNAVALLALITFLRHIRLKEAFTVLHGYAIAQGIENKK